MRYFCTFIILFLSFSIIAQVGAVEFGKNRVQFREFIWNKYETDRFIIYWYQEGMSLGQFTAMVAEKDLDEIQSLVEYRINSTIEILVFNDLDDLKQSNIGTEEIVSGETGITKVSGNKIFIYFNGSHSDLQKQIRQGISLLILDRMMYGWSLQEMMQNSVAVQIPDWFLSGLASFVGEAWNVDIDNRMRDLHIHDQLDFYNLVKTNPRLAGHSMWYYLSKNYGSNTIANLLYLTRINRSVEGSFMYVLGTTEQTMISNWKHFFTSRYNQEVSIDNRISDQQNAIKIRNKRNIPLTNFKVSPNGEQLLYVLNDRSKIRIF
jgi:hypothetical protein